MKAKAKRNVKTAEKAELERWWPPQARYADRPRRVKYSQKVRRFPILQARRTVRARDLPSAKTGLTMPGAGARFR
jgi:hypothetical protein